MRMDADKIIAALGIDMLRELRAIAWFCDASMDGNMALIPRGRCEWYKAGGEMDALTRTGCVRLVSRTRIASLDRTGPAIRMEQAGRRVLVRARALMLPLEAEEPRP
jgi:hypothetical protein